MSVQKTIESFECYGISEIKEDTFNIMDTNIVIRSKIDAWFAKDLFFPYEMKYLFDYSSTFDQKNICLLIEVHLEGQDFSSEKVAIAAKTIDQTKLPAIHFQLPTSYKINYEKASNIFKPKTETKITIREMKFEELDSIPAPAPPKRFKSSDQKPVKQKSGNN